MSSSDPVFVRPAGQGHAPFIAQLQTRSMLDILAVEFPDVQLDGLLDQEAMSRMWKDTIIRDPRDGQGVFVATETEDPVGFLAVDSSLPPAGSDETVVATEILALDVAADHRGAGHGSRMLAAAADVARAAGAAQLQVWLVPGEQEKIHFYQSAGFAPSGRRRAFDVAGQRLVQHLWYALLEEEHDH